MLPDRHTSSERPPAHWVRGLSRFTPHLIGLVVFAFALGMVLPDLTEQPIRHWDGSRYANTAQAMKAHGRYLFTVDEHGKYAIAGLSKPPLLQWGMIASIGAFGQGLFALRFPTALATALTAWIAYGYAARTAPGARGHRAVGVVAGLCLALLGGTAKYSQILCIEPVLVFWVSLTLLLYAEAMASGGRRAIGLAVLAGLGIAGAFLTKQLACATVVFAIVLAEALVSFRDVRRALVRLTAAAIPAMAISGAWLYLAYRAVGDRLYGLFFTMSVQKRVSGFGSKHRRWLNRMEELLDTTMSPFDWELAFLALALLLGVALLALRRNRSSAVAALLPVPERRGFLVLPATYVLCWIVVYGNVSKTLLEWYAVGLSFPGALGVGYLVAAPALVRSSSEGGAPRPLSAAAWIASVTVLALAASRVSEEHFSRLNLVAVLMVVLVLSLVLGRELAVAWRLVGRWVPTALLTAVGAIATLRLASPTLDPDPFHLFAQETDAEGIDAVWISKGYPRGFKGTYLASSFLPPGGVKRGAPPWSPKAKRPARAAVVEGALPLELDAGPGTTVTRGAGSYLVIGAPKQDPSGPGRLERVLQKGPLTIESEHLVSQHTGTVVRDARASNGLARAYERWGTRPVGTTSWFAGGNLRLPKGDHVARFFVALDCGSEAVSGVLSVTQGRGKLGSRKVQCPDGAAGDYASYDVPFRQTGTKPIDIKVEGFVRHDKTEIWSWGTLNGRKPKGRKKRS